jgi:hypothetical protein
MSQIPPDPERDGEACGRSAGEKYRRAAEQGAPFADVVALWPRDSSWRKNADEMVLSEDEHVRASGRWWLAFLTAFETAFPDHQNYIKA